MDVKVLVGFTSVVDVPFEDGEKSRQFRRGRVIGSGAMAGKTLGIAAKPLVFAEFNLSDEELRGQVSGWGYGRLKLLTVPVYWSHYKGTSNISAAYLVAILKAISYNSQSV